MRKIKFFAMAALATIFAGCSNNDDEVMQPKDSLKDTPINVNVLLTDIQTRAGYDNTNQPTKFYLSIDQANENYDYTNVVMKYENDSWVAYESDAGDAPKKQLLWEGSAGNVTVTAATFSLGNSPSYSLSASADQSSDAQLKSSDHLYYYSNAVEPSTDGISIPFDHIMSKLEITLTLRDEFEGLDNPITSVVLSGTSLSATYLPQAEEKWSGYSTAANDEAIKTCPSVAYNKYTRTATYEVILLPQNVNAHTFCVTIFIGDKSYEWTSSSAITLESSNKYTLALTAGMDKVSGNSFTAAPWASGGADINNKAE
ncbi:MAG: fimbrillin family protein [Prevotella sp.]